MLRIASFLSSVCVCFMLCLVCFSQSTGHESEKYNYNAVPVVSGLEHMWGMVFLPNGDMLVTERPGRLRIVREGILLDASIAGVPEVHARGQGGLLDVILHPQFESNRFVYLSYSKPIGGNSTTAVARGRFENHELLDVEDIFVADSRGRGHFGSRLAFDNDGFLFITVGDRQASPSGDLEAHAAQDLSNHHGTINRVHDDGSIPEDNPFVDVPDAEPSIWSYGHRNPQGLINHPVTGKIWSVEHGPKGGDELNLIVKGANYGWPVIGYGVNYGGSGIHDSTRREGMRQPLHFWVPSISPAGLLVYSGDKFPDWNGNMFVGGLSGQQIARLTTDGQKVIGEETLYSGFGRIRDIHQGPDGYIYLGRDTTADNPSIIRLEPQGTN